MFVESDLVLNISYVYYEYLNVNCKKIYGVDYILNIIIVIEFYVLKFVSLI